MSSAERSAAVSVIRCTYNKVIRQVSIDVPNWCDTKTSPGAGIADTGGYKLNS